MAKQFPDVSGKYGAPMGRSESPLGQGARSVRVFAVRLDSGGYDDGGAYWGTRSGGRSLYCAVCDEGGRQFVEATSRLAAIAALEIECFTLKAPPVAKFKQWAALVPLGYENLRPVVEKLQALGFGEPKPHPGRFHVVQYRNGVFDGVMSGMGKHRGTLDSDHSRRAAQRHAKALRAESWRATAGLSYKVETTT